MSRSPYPPLSTFAATLAALLLSAASGLPAGARTPTAPLTSPIPDPSPGLPAGAADVSATLLPILARHKVPALAVAVIRDGKVIAAGASGTRRRAGPEAVTLNDQWHLGSCTKSMTATLCARLVERGILRWDQTLAETFPEHADKMNPAFRAVTLEQLLTHRGGVPGDLRFDGLWNRLWRFEGTSTEARTLMLSTVTRREPKPRPGEFEYSNGGVSLAGLMAERATGKPWEELIAAEVFAPLGITSAGFGAPGTTETIDQPRGHIGKGGPMEPGPSADNPAAIGPAGRVHMTITDWAKYIAAHLEGEALGREAGTPQPAPPEAKPCTMIFRGMVLISNSCGPMLYESIGPALLAKASWKKLHAPAPKLAEKDAEYAMGWSVTERPWATRQDSPTAAAAVAPTSQRVLTHNGSNTMWYCVAWLAPDADFGVIVCCNQASEAGPAACDETAAAMIRAFRPK
ncbi:hypothetical protein BH11PLA1_BH11PLA1_02740 [soil metagenome]